MADAVASPLIKMLSDRLDAVDSAFESPPRLLRMLPPKLRRRIDRSWILKDFQLTLAELQGLVVQAENRSEDDAALLRWISMVKDAVYEVNDVLDEFTLPLKFTFQLEMANSVPRLRMLIGRRRTLEMANSVPRLRMLIGRRRTMMMPLPTATPADATSEAALKLRHLQKLPLFILSNIDGCSRINELCELDLRGELEIKNLEHVSRPEDAHRAKLFDKQNLHTLKLSWNGYSHMSDEVLENLKPPRELKVLCITGYGGLGYPSWLLSSFPENLVSLSIINCSCKEVPPLGQLPNLEYLCIKEMIAVKIIDQTFYGAGSGIKGFPSLKSVDLYNTLLLEEWWSFELEGEDAAFPCLKSLTIVGCPKLSRIPVVPNLEKLALRNCNGELLLSLKQQTSLPSLVISDYLDILPRPLGNLHSVRAMTLYRCDRLLYQLEPGMEGFSSLEHLRILYCEELVSLPTGLRDLTSLRRLEIVGCPKVAYVPDIFYNLSALEEFVIDGCPMLTTLPSLISCANLQKLVIRGCPELREQQLYGEEWSKIAHIPSIETDKEDQDSEERLKEASDSFIHAPLGSGI